MTTETKQSNKSTSFRLRVDAHKALKRAQLEMVKREGKMLSISQTIILMVKTLFKEK